MLSLPSKFIAVVGSTESIVHVIVSTDAEAGTVPHLVTILGTQSPHVGFMVSVHVRLVPDRVASDAISHGAKAKLTYWISVISVGKFVPVIVTTCVLVL
jgi:hypothetical protein